MRVPFTRRALQVGNLVSLAKHLPFRITVPILHGPARGMKWILASTEPNYWFRSYEEEKINRLLTFLKPQTVFYDVGANVGYYSLIAARRCKTVYAFEPLPENFCYLRRHVQINGLTNCNLIEAAANNAPGMAHFCKGATCCEGALKESGQVLVAAIQIDAFVKTAQVPHVLKIDVEGGELNVLHGAKHTLTTYRPVIFLATHSDELDRQCRDFLMECGYTVECLENRELLAT